MFCLNSQQERSNTMEIITKANLCNLENNWFINKKSFDDGLT